MAESGREEKETGTGHAELVGGVIFPSAGVGISAGLTLAFVPGPSLLATSLAFVGLWSIATGLGQTAGG